MSPLPEWVELQKRKPNRAQGHDYTQGGYYHIVFCTDLRRPMLGKLVGTEVELNGLGRMLAEEIERLHLHFDGLAVDCYRIMDNHVHLLLFNDGLNPKRPNICRVVQRLKSVTATRYLKWRNLKELFHLPAVLWQRSFWDTYIKHEDQLHAVREYLLNNPLAEALKPSQAVP